MESQLGIIKTMQSGGQIPVNVNEETISKIKKTIGTNKAKKIFQNVNPQGLEEIEFDYKLCYHDNFNDKLFVISQKRQFNGQKIIKDKFCIYCFDLKGNEIEYDLKDNYINGFYENCYILKQLMN